MGNYEVVVLEVDFIREFIIVLLLDDVKVFVNLGELFIIKLEEEKFCCSYKRRCVEELFSLLIFY